MATTRCIRIPLAFAIQVALASPGAHAADIDAQLGAGDAFKVTSQSGAVVRLRVNSDGSVIVPALPAALAEEQFLCFDSGTGQLGRCLTQPAGPTGHMGPTGPTGATGVAGPAGVAGVLVNPSGRVSVTDSTGTQTSTDAASRVSGNSGTGPLGFGTTRPTDIDVIAGNAVRARFTPSSELNFGAISSPHAGDLLRAMSTSALPFAVNGYGAYNGAGVWGEILSANTTSFSAVQGVYGGSGNGAGVLGNYSGTNTSVIRADVSGVLSAPTSAAGGAGVFGRNNIASGNQPMGVLGQYAGSAFGLGVVGVGFGGGIPTGDLAIGVVGWRMNNENCSGYFNGNHVIANGTKSASAAASW